MQLSGIQKFTTLDYPKKLACIAFTPGCNFRCGYCYNHEFVLPECLAKIKDSFIDEDIFFNFLDQRKGFLEAVVVSGGEPTLMPDLKDFIKKIKSRGFLVKLDTNGSNPELLEELLQLSLVDYIAMDLKTGLSNYNELIAAKLDLKKLQKSIKLIKESNIEYEFRSTLIKEVHDKEQIKEMKEMLTGAKRLYLQLYKNHNPLNKDFLHYTAFSKKEMDSFKDYFSEAVDTVSSRV